MIEAPLSKIEVELGDHIYNEIAGWKFEEDFVWRVMNTDIPQRVKYGNARILAFRDLESTVVGFGTLDICREWSVFADNSPHVYIPLLAVNPAMRRRGYGKAILDLLCKQASALTAENQALYPALFLDVYERSEAAIAMYRKSGFIQISDPIVDPQDGETFLVMAKSIDLGSRLF